MSPDGPDRATVIADIARLLPQQTGQISRLLFRHARGPLHRGMSSVLATLGDGPETIGRLAELEGVAQPTLTRMVERLETEGLVRRERSQRDGRVVLVQLTPSGKSALTALRRRYLAALRQRLETLPDDELRSLHAASEALGVLVTALRDEGS
jgi:DNA-binding MarR family transcriptional regulator